MSVAVLTKQMPHTHMPARSVCTRSLTLSLAHLRSLPAVRIFICCSASKKFNRFRTYSHTHTHTQHTLTHHTALLFYTHTYTLSLSRSLAHCCPLQICSACGAAAAAAQWCNAVNALCAVCRSRNARPRNPTVPYCKR